MLPSRSSGTVHFICLGLCLRGHLLVLGVCLLGGTLSHFVLEPALLPGGMLAESVGQWIGIGKGRGTGFLFVLVGPLGALVSLTGILSRRLRQLEDEIKDAF